MYCEVLKKNSFGDGVHEDELRCLKFDEKSSVYPGMFSKCRNIGHKSKYPSLDTYLPGIVTGVDARCEKLKFEFFNSSDVINTSIWAHVTDLLFWNIPEEDLSIIEKKRQVILGLKRDVKEKVTSSNNDAVYIKNPEIINNGKIFLVFD